ESGLLRDLRGQLQSSRTVQHAGLSLTVQALPPAFPSATDTQKTYCGATRPHTSTGEVKLPIPPTGHCSDSDSAGLLRKPGCAESAGGHSAPLPRTDWKEL